LQLGGLYESGRGVQKNLKAAATLYRSVVNKYSASELVGAAEIRLTAMQN